MDTLFCQLQEGFDLGLEAFFLVLPIKSSFFDIKTRVILVSVMLEKKIRKRKKVSSWLTSNSETEKSNQLNEG